MKLQTFFETFDQLADMPNAVAKMRDLVTQLAVQGKLVEQNTEDEPADELVSRVVASLPKKQSDNPFLSEISPDITSETPYELPNGWAWLPLGHVGVWATGCGFPKQYQGETEGEFLFCKVSDMNLPGNEIEIRMTVNSIDSEIMKKVRARANPVGTVIFPKIGGAIATNKRRLIIKPTIIDNNCSGIQPIGLTDSKWLFILMRSIDLKKYQTGTSVPAVSQGALDPIRIGLPPLAEQRRIVAKVDELMALCNRLEAQQQERDTRHAALDRASLARFAEAPTPANLDFLFHISYAITPADLRKTILTLAVQGKLAPQDPSDEPAEVLIERIKGERLRLDKVGKTGKAPDYAPIIESARPYEIPDSWAWIPLGNVAFIRTGKLDANASSPDGQYPFFTCARDPLRIDSYAYDGECVLLAGNGNFDVNYYDGRFEAYQRTYIIEGVSRQVISGRYLFRFTQLYADTLRGMSIGGVISYIKIGFLTDAPFPLPPIAEQRRIVAKVDQLMALVDQLETQLTASRATAAKLMEAVVAELTTQD